VETTESTRLRELAAEFAAQASGPAANVDLGRCALLIGAIADPSLVVDRHEIRLDDLAAGAAQHTSPDRLAIDRVTDLAHYLFDRLGFAGDRADYYDPQNSYLHRVIDRRRGLPITLSILLIEVGRRLDLVIEGVGTPQHFLVRAPDGPAPPSETGPAPETDPPSPAHPHTWRFLDPFNGGNVVDTDELRAALRRMQPESDDRGDTADAFLAALTKRQILTRVLHNLKGAAARRGETVAALGAIEYLIALTPWAIEEIRDRGLLSASLQLTDGALADLRTYRDQALDAPDRARVEAAIRRLAQD
jgi:regulator of sirC expression with transglutaminase-like and TPR domain